MKLVTLIDKSLKSPKVFFRYEYKGKRTTFYSNVTLNPKHWDSKKKRVKSTDKQYKIKNLHIEKFQNSLTDCINELEFGGYNVTTDLLKSKFNHKSVEIQSTTIDEIFLTLLLQNWQKEYQSDKEIEESTKAKSRSLFKDIFSFVEEYETKIGRRMFIEDLKSDGFLRGFMDYLYTKPIYKNGTLYRKGLQPITCIRRFTYLQVFCKWYRKTSNKFLEIEIPKEMKDAVSKSDKDLVFLNRGEVERLWAFDDFDFEKDKWQKYLTPNRNGNYRKTKKGVMIEMIDRIDDKGDFSYSGFRTYTSYEVYLDLFLFMCSCGARFTDAVNMKLSNFKHLKRSDDKGIGDSDITASFEFKQVKTNTTAIPKVNELSFDIYKKYSKGKHREDYLFPQFGNKPIQNQNFNQAIKHICKIIGLNRRIKYVEYGRKGKTIDSNDVRPTEKRLWEMVSSHVGRKTFINMMITEKNYSELQMMAQTGHRSSAVFKGYTQQTKETLGEVKSELFSRKWLNTNVFDEERIEEIDVVKDKGDMNPIIQPKSLKQLLEELEEVKDILTPSEYKKRRETILTKLT